MKNILIILFIIILLPHLALATPTIVTSITPLASLVSMLTKDKVNVIALDVDGGCPHHHNAKPSDKAKLENAHVAIYISEEFESLLSSIILDSKAQKIKISEFSMLDFKGLNNENNWHFWLNLNNVKLFQKELALKLIEIFPDLEEEISKNLNDSLEKIENLYRRKKALSMAPAVLLESSLEHFFKDINSVELKLFELSNSSLKKAKALYKYLEKDSVKCIILTTEQNIDNYKKYNKVILQLDSENWTINKAEALEDLFINKYKQMIETANKCKIN